MGSAILQGFRIDALEVFPMRGLIVKPGGAAEHIEPKVMDVLVCLALRANVLVTREELLEEVWPGRVAADSQLTRAISELRRTLEKDKSLPSLIETVPKRGYRLVGTIELHPDDGMLDTVAAATDDSSNHRVGVFVLAAAVVIALIAFGRETLMNGDDGPRSPQSDTASRSMGDVSTSDAIAFQHYMEGVQHQQVKTNRALRLAELAFREALARDSGFFEAKLELGYTYWELQRVGEMSQADAKELLQPILDQLRHEAPDNGLVLALDTFVRYRELADFEAREASLIAAIAQTPHEPRLYRNLARLLAANGREKDALEWLDRGLRAVPNDWDLHAGRGRLLLRSGENELADASIKKALLLNPEDPTLLGNAASIALQRGDYSEWYSTWLRAMEVAPHDDEVPAYIALQLYTFGLNDEADEFLQRAYDVQPRKSWSQVPLLYRHLVTEDSEGAYELSKAMLMERQENRWGANDIALTVFVSTAIELGMTADALQILEQLSPADSKLDSEPQMPVDVRYRQSAFMLGQTIITGERLSTDIRHDADRTDLDIAFAFALGENDSAVRMTLEALSPGLALVGNTLPYNRFRHLEILRPVTSDSRVSSRLDEIDLNAARAADEIRAFMSQ
jgi:DNA-binding winged helix-turn-helix (wHTH) protein/Flp pilus assembly protein TadD